METGEIHSGQNFLDNLWLQLAIGIGWPFLSYAVWGFIDILSTPLIAN